MADSTGRAIGAVDTPSAPKAIGPYSQAIATGDLVFLSGQIGLDTSGALVDGGITAETHQVFRNLEAVLGAAGTSLSRVVKSTVYLADLGEFATMNEIYAGYMRQPPPARSTVQVAALPRGARVEIDVIAVI
jgi:2-iminobutanoate/2-iminopropanoate deaminase